MQDDIARLTDVNNRIAVAESAGDRVALAAVLVPALGFRRANGQVIDRAAFLAAVSAGAVRETELEQIQLFGNRAVVSGLVRMETAEGPKTVHNLRLFIRGEAGWQLLGWANEAVG
jgi:Domain of unknown function (DUF4440)